MASPSEFPEQNWLLGKPVDMTDEQCSALPCFIDAEQVVSCWQLTQEECEEIGRTGKVFIGVRGASTPAMWLTGINPFSQPGVPNEVLGISQP